MLEGLLVDLVPMNKTFRDLEHTWRNSEAGYWFSGGDRRFLTRAQNDQQMAERLDVKEQGQENGAVFFGIQTKAGKPIGHISINYTLAFSRVANLGAWIGEPEYWGGGYGTDALLLIVDYAFDWLDMRKVWLNTTGKNGRVLRQMEKVGFRLEVQQREFKVMDGEWVDVVHFGLLREEWPGREAMIQKLSLSARL